MIHHLLYIQISDTRCRYVQTNYADAQLPFDILRVVIKRFVKDMMDNWHKSFNKVCAIHAERGFVRPEKHFGFLTTLDDFMARYLPEKDSVKTWDVPVINLRNK